jgi:hypothetical protein
VGSLSMKRRMKLHAHCNSLFDGEATQPCPVVNRKLVYRHFQKVAGKWVEHYEQHPDPSSRAKLLTFAYNNHLVDVATHHLVKPPKNSTLIASSLRVMDRVGGEDLCDEVVPFLRSQDRNLKFEAAKYLLHYKACFFVGIVMEVALLEPRLSEAQIAVLLKPLRRALIEDGFWHCLAVIPVDLQTRLVGYLSYLTEPLTRFPLTFFLPIHDREMWLKTALDHVSDSSYLDLVLSYCEHPSEGVRRAATDAIRRLEGDSRPVCHPGFSGLHAFSHALNASHLSINHSPYQEHDT